MSFLTISSLRWRLVAVMSLAYIFVAVITAVVGYRAQSASFSSQLDARAKTDAEIVAAGSVAPLTTNNPRTSQTLQDFLSSIKVAQGQGVLSVAVSGQNGCIVASTRSREVDRCEKAGLIGRAIAIHEHNGDVKGEAPISGAGTTLGVASVMLSDASVQAALRDNLIQESVFRTIGLVLFFVLTLLIAQFILGPLGNLVRAARQIHGGRLSTRVPIRGRTELATVAEAFNEMAASLEQRIEHLTFLATTAAVLPSASRERADIRPLLQDLCAAIDAQVAGLVTPERALFWCAEGGADCQKAAGVVTSRPPTYRTVQEGDYRFMTVPVPGDAVFVTGREASRPFNEEEQQVITNFAYQLGIATDNVRLFDAQQEALQVKDQFLSIVSHELRTPLTTMKGYSQMLRRKLIDDLDGQRFAASIDAQVTRLSRLVDDLLDVTRFARGQFELTRRQMDLRPVLEDIVNRFRVITPNHSLELDLDGGSFQGYWDRDRLEQVLNNLIGNAIKYSPDGGKVTVNAHHEDDHLVVAVTDEGIGIPEDEQSKLFERFYRGSAETYDIQGMGLGLYVTSRVIDAHGGQVGVTSKPGEGSTFSFTLPLSEVPEPEPAAR